MTILPWTHAIADMPSSGRDYTRQASPEECAALSADLGLLACQDVSAPIPFAPSAGAATGSPAPSRLTSPNLAS